MQTVYVWTFLFVIHQAYSQSNMTLDRLTGGENIAIGKTTRQSSSFVDDNFTFSSNLSVDGNEDADFNQKSCSSTHPNGSRPAWWSVDFGEQRILKKIIIVNRKGYTDRLTGARVLGLMKNGTELEIDRSANYNQDRITIDVTINKLLHNVTIVLRNDSISNIINICEVKIYADLNVARRKPVNQTLTWGTFEAELAVDGTSSGYFDTGKSCTAAQKQNQLNASWSVNLEEEYFISIIKIFNRINENGNSYEQRLGNFTVMGYTRYNNPIKLYQDATGNPGVVIELQLYNISTPVSCIKISVPLTQDILTLCEVEIYKAIECQIYRLDNGRVSIVMNGDNKQNFTYRASLKLECLTGFQFSPNVTVTTATCQINGTWTEHRSCQDINECELEGNSCKNHGECKNTAGSFTCQCYAGYTGHICETDIDECTEEGPSPCNNHGECVDGVATFTCQCQTGYTGSKCETDIDECKEEGPSPCNNHGECVDAVAHFTCQCHVGYTGQQCETDINECKLEGPSPCNNHGECVDTVANFTCQCHAGYTGRKCETDIDECKEEGPSPCNNHGECVDAVAHFTCQCHVGYTGQKCETDINECKLEGPSPCNNQGECVDTVANFTCQCHAGYTGRKCETDINECKVNGPSPCNNHGECVDAVANFSCQCHAGYTGSQCETVIHCQKLSQPDFGIILDKDNTGIEGNWTYHTKVSIECNAGYTLIGDGLVECNGSGYWNGTLGNCSEALKYVGPESSAAGVAGGVAAAICVVIIAVIIAFILYKRRKTKQEDAIVDTAMNEIPSPSEDKKQAEKIILEKSFYAQPKESKYATKGPDIDDSKHIYMNSNESSKDYYSYLPQKGTDKYIVRVEDLSSFFQSRKLKPNLYEEEYNKLPNGLIKSHDVALQQENRSKNRYKNIYPYDETRVILEICDPSNENDYINASYINGFKTFHTYIAAQGPTKGILNDFWKMIWQTKCSKIVMLTNLIEEGKHKCEKYWPDNGVLVFGDIVVKLVQLETFADFTIRTLELIKKNGKPEDWGKGTRQIKQFHFTSWPDRGVPRFASSLVHFRSKIHVTKTLPKNEGPMVVHCSAGIGRTGTFLALDYLLHQAEEVGYINVVNCVETLRKQRVSMVQTVEQYIFLHEALVEALTSSSMALSTSEFQEAYRTLLELDKKTGTRRLDAEFEKLPMYVSDPGEDVYENAKNMGNRDKNRYTNILPDKNHCPFLNIYVKGRDSYINAVFLPAYKENDIFIITQTPLANTIVDFWRMVYQFDVGSIVMMNTLSEMKEEERYWTEDEETLEILPFRITLESKSSDDICTNYTMLLNYHDERRRVRLSRATYWGNRTPVPNTPSAMLRQIDLIQTWQQETGNKPIIVHCMNGAERSGLFCVIAALLERTNIEQDVAVEQIIKQMRSRRPQIIPNVDQFKFCYDAVLAYMDQFEAYSNFTGL